MNKKILIFILLFSITFMLTACNNKENEEIYFNEILEEHLYSNDISYEYINNNDKPFNIKNYSLLQGMIKMLYTNSRLLPLDKKQTKKYNSETEYATITSKIDNEKLIIKLYKDDTVIIDVNDVKYITKSNDIKYSDFTNFIDIKETFYTSHGQMDLYIDGRLHICSNNYSSLKLYDYVSEFDYDNLLKMIQLRLKQNKASYESEIKEDLNYYLMGLIEIYPDLDYESKINDQSFINRYSNFNDEELYKLLYGYDSFMDYLINGDSLFKDLFTVYLYSLNMKYYEAIKNSSIKILYVPYFIFADNNRKARSSNIIDNENNLIISYDLLSYWNYDNYSLKMYDNGGYIFFDDKNSRDNNYTYLVSYGSFDDLLIEMDSFKEEINQEYNNFKKEIEKLWLEYEE